MKMVFSEWKVHDTHKCAVSKYHKYFKNSSLPP